MPSLRAATASAFKEERNGVKVYAGVVDGTWSVQAYVPSSDPWGPTYSETTEFQTEVSSPETFKLLLLMT